RPRSDRPPWPVAAAAPRYPFTENTHLLHRAGSGVARPSRPARVPRCVALSSRWYACAPAPTERLGWSEGEPTQSTGDVCDPGRGRPPFARWPARDVPVFVFALAAAARGGGALRYTRQNEDRHGCAAPRRCGGRIGPAPARGEEADLRDRRGRRQRRLAGDPPERAQLAAQGCVA